MRNKIFQFLIYLFVYDLILFAYKCTKLKLHASNLDLYLIGIYRIYYGQMYRTRNN